MTLIVSPNEEIRALKAENTRLKIENSRMKRLLALDPLTKVPNRSAFNKILRREWKRAVRNGSKISLLVLDLDQFPPFIDAHGEQEGERLLRRTTRTWMHVVRRSGDIIARYDQTLFAVLLPDTDKAGAVKVANELLQATLPLGTTASIGAVCCYAIAGSDPVPLVRTAKEALQQAKSQGGNQCYMA